MEPKGFFLVIIEPF